MTETGLSLDSITERTAHAGVAADACPLPKAFLYARERLRVIDSLANLFVIKHVNASGVA